MYPVDGDRMIISCPRVHVRTWSRNCEIGNTLQQNMSALELTKEGKTSPGQSQSIMLDEGKMSVWKCFVFPGVAPTATRCVWCECCDAPSNALMTELFPTFGYPTMPNLTRPLSSSRVPTRAKIVAARFPIYAKSASRVMTRWVSCSVSSLCVSRWPHVLFLSLHSCATFVLFVILDSSSWMLWLFSSSSLSVCELLDDTASLRLFAASKVACASFAEKNTNSICWDLKYSAHSVLRRGEYIYIYIYHNHHAKYEESETSSFTRSYRCSDVKKSALLTINIESLALSISFTYNSKSTDR